MKWTAGLVLCLTATLVTSPLSGDENDDARQQVLTILDGINARSFDPIRRAINEKEMLANVFAARQIGQDGRRWFQENFWEFVESRYMGSLPPKGSKRPYELVQFSLTGDRGLAILRQQRPRYQYDYQALEFGIDSRGRLQIDDIRRYNVHQGLVGELAEYLVTVVPDRAVARQLLTQAEPDEGDLFQITELLKAFRDGNGARFFQIYGDLDERLQRDPGLARYALVTASLAGDAGFRDAVLPLVPEIFQNDAGYALSAADIYLALGRLDEGYAAMQAFRSQFGFEEGAIPARLSALALALGRTEEAVRHAEAAVDTEPTLELGWWSLLRAQAGAGDIDGALGSLTRLEDDFGHRLTAEKLARDRWKAFVLLTESDAYKAWREGRP